MDINHQDTKHILFTSDTNNNNQIDFTIICYFKSHAQKPDAVSLKELSFSLSKKCQINIHWGKKGQYCIDGKTEGLESYSISTSYDNHKESRIVHGSYSIVYDDCNLFEYRNTNGLIVTIQKSLNGIKSDVINYQIPNDTTYSEQSEEKQLLSKCQNDNLIFYVSSTTSTSISIKWILNCKRFYNIESIQLFISTTYNYGFQSCLLEHNDVMVEATETEYTFNNLISNTIYYINVRAKLVGQTCGFIKFITNTTSIVKSGTSSSEFNQIN